MTEKEKETELAKFGTIEQHQARLEAMSAYVDGLGYNTHQKSALFTELLVKTIIKHAEKEPELAHALALASMFTLQKFLKG